MATNADPYVRQIRAEIDELTKQRNAKYREMRELDKRIAALMREIADRDIAKYKTKRDE